jgi:hypothetical protein
MLYESLTKNRHIVPINEKVFQEAVAHQSSNTCGLTAVVQILAIISLSRSVKASLSSASVEL